MMYLHTLLFVSQALPESYPCAPRPDNVIQHNVTLCCIIIYYDLVYYMCYMYNMYICIYVYIYIYIYRER